MKEIEVKIIGVNCEDIKNKVISLGGVQTKHEFQENHIFSLPKHLNSNGYIRIRVIKDYLHNRNSVLLCIKKILSQDEVRIVDENEFEVSSFNEANGFLSALNIEFIAQENKERVSYKLNNSLIEFEKWDESVFPIPYVEVESPSVNELNNILDILSIDKSYVTSKGLIEIKKEMGI
ncbi:MAG: CYTH domain-containing protein [Clostridium sp.]|uniref:CYTH domain-containing protein n=1 Tax=Clostridium sp. TaxID=1506 RepID=UPI002FCB50A4